jgi:hypothetical protein
MLPSLLNEVSSNFGLFIGLGFKLVDKTMEKIDSELQLVLRRAVNYAMPRVIPSYAIMLWFSMKVKTSVNYMCIV